MSGRDDEFWANFLGVEPVEFAGSGVTVCGHAGLDGYRGFWCFRRKERTVLSAPAGWVPRLEVLAAGADGAGDTLMQASFWQRALGDDFERAIGPAFQGCLAPADFRPVEREHVRAVVDDDRAALDEFRDACGDDWNMPEDAKHFRHACFEGGAITALAGYRSWSDDAGDPGVITRPGARSGGRGSAVTSAVVRDGLAAGKLMLYQTLEANLPAVGIAFALGYERYANHLAVRLHRDTPA